MAPLFCAVFSRIIEGKDAREGRWPWQVSVQFYVAKKGDYHHICGGSLISAQWVVSAAHCFSCSQCCSQYRLVLGAHQLLNPSPNQILVNVKQIILHPHYNKKTKIADIALVRLEKPVKSTKFIRPISLPGAFRKFPEKMKCWVTGWGRVQMNRKCQKSQRGTGSP
ncbi:Serine protease 27 [Chelonia mydas]|uniref:Serine protease 27 n=1 Tax=Chelonia mydas TaxID=8469 RepID=M7CIF3_CHEMY|nr:Serine protease 27 [Chelonia mydas]